jgi:hypothetical protein
MVDMMNAACIEAKSHISHWSRESVRKSLGSETPGLETGTDVA